MQSGIHVAMTFDAYREAVTNVLRQVAQKALHPTARVAQHWQSTEQVTWFGASADHHQLHVSWSYGRLRDVPPLLGVRETVGVFALNEKAFPDIDDAALRAKATALVPSETDGATRVYLLRVMSQLATKDALVTIGTELGCETLLFARPDASQKPAPAIRMPTHALDRIEAALAKMDPQIRARLVAGA